MLQSIYNYVSICYIYTRESSFIFAYIIRSFINNTCSYIEYSSKLTVVRIQQMVEYQLVKIVAIAIALLELS